MIALNNVTSIKHVGTLRVRVFDSLTFDFPTDKRFAILSKSPIERQELVYLLCDTKTPDSGTLTRLVSVSYPVGFASGFYHKLSILENLSFVAALFGCDRMKLIDLVVPILGRTVQVDTAMYYLPNYQKQQLAFVLSYALPFDVYVANNVLMPYDDDLRGRLAPLMEARLKRSGLILVTGLAQVALASCDHAAVLYEGRIIQFDDVKAAVAFFRKI